MAESRGRKINRFIVLFLALVFSLSAAGFGWVYSSLPSHDGEVRLAGLGAPVTIFRDDDGVPYIFAGSETDAAFALGYSHAQDRLWQMELQRRIGAGRAQSASQQPAPRGFDRSLSVESKNGIGHHVAGARRENPRRWRDCLRVGAPRVRATGRQPSVPRSHARDIG